MLAMGKVLCRGTKHLGCGLQRGMNVSEYKLLTERERKRKRPEEKHDFCTLVGNIVRSEVASMSRLKLRGIHA